jgi:hypothetical protein
MRTYRNLSLSLLLALTFVPNLWAQDATASADAVETTQPAAEATPEAKRILRNVPYEGSVLESLVDAEAEKPAKRIVPAKKETDGGKLFIVAYIVFWLLPLYLLWITSRRVRRLEDDLKELRGLIPDGNEEKVE